MEVVGSSPASPTGSATALVVPRVVSTGPTVAGVTSRIDELVAAARRRIQRVEPQAAYRLQQDGALLVDTRPVEQRLRFGEIPGALVIDRNVLEWRLDPTSDHRHPVVAEGYPFAIVVVCQEGYSSSLAAATLVELGVPAVHDLAGGFAAWAAAGLPVEAACVG